MKKQSGFTLIELAIVLVIIGLLLGGVLKGQELINSARIKNVVNDFNSTSAAIYGYQDRYRALPGDELQATKIARWAGTAYPATPGGDGDGTINSGTGNVCGFTDGSPGVAAAAGDECNGFWIDLRQAGFITGALASGPPKNAYDAPLGVQDGNDALTTAGQVGSGFKGIIVCEANIPDKTAQAIDTQMDDGKPDTGSIRAIKQANATTPKTAAALSATADAVYVENGTTYYTVCKAQQ